jgi:RNA polymerase sigma-70 factor (ECF subfamily)
VQAPDWEYQLANSCASGDRSAQQDLYARFCDDMLILCFRYIPEREEAREALMDGFLACFKSIASFGYRGAGSLKAWLKQIMINACLAKLRKRPPVPTDLLGNEATDIGIEASALEQLSAKEILQLVQELPDGYRTVFNLYCFEGVSHKDIAAMLGISEATSKSQLSKAKARLRERLPDHSTTR